MHHWGGQLVGSPGLGRTGEPWVVPLRPRSILGGGRGHPRRAVFGNSRLLTGSRPFSPDSPAVLLCSVSAPCVVSSRGQPPLPPGPGRLAAASPGPDWLFWPRSLHADASSFLAMRAAGRCARAPAVRPLGGFALLLRWFSCPASQASEEAQFSTCFATHVPRTLGSEGRKHTASTHSPVPLYDYRPGQAGLFGSSQTTCRDADLLPPPRRT